MPTGPGAGIAQFNISQVDDHLVTRLIDLGSHNGFSLSLLSRPRTSTQGAPPP
jgi:hypothetical protein